MAQRTISSDGVTATLWAIVEEIDDDDEDILEVTIDVVNESSRDLWDISGDIRAMDGTHANPRGAPSRIGAGDSDELTFWVPSDTGAWLFKIDYNTDSGLANRRGQPPAACREGRSEFTDGNGSKRF